eukprot:9404378-Pyramimonas_sp.AAC.1
MQLAGIPVVTGSGRGRGFVHSVAKDVAKHSASIRAQGHPLTMNPNERPHRVQNMIASTHEGMPRLGCGCTCPRAVSA